MTVKEIDVGVSDSLPRIVRWALLNVGARQIDRDIAKLPAHGLDPLRGNHHFAAGQPFACVDYQKTDTPVGVVDKEVFHLADRSVARGDLVSANLMHAA